MGFVDEVSARCLIITIGISILWKTFVLIDGFWIARNGVELVSARRHDDSDLEAFNFSSSLKLYPTYTFDLIICIAIGCGLTLIFVQSRQFIIDAQVGSTCYMHAIAMAITHLLNKTKDPLYFEPVMFKTLITWMTISYGTKKPGTTSTVLSSVLRSHYVRDKANNIQSKTYSSYQECPVVYPFQTGKGNEEYLIGIFNWSFVEILFAESVTVHRDNPAIITLNQFKLPREVSVDGSCGHELLITEITETHIRLCDNSYGFRMYCLEKSILDEPNFDYRIIRIWRKTKTTSVPKFIVPAQQAMVTNSML